MKAKDTLIQDREVDTGCGDDESVVDITSWLETQATVSFEAGQRECQSRIGELEAQLADIKNQFKIQIEAAHEEGYKEGLAEGGKICKVITERAVQKAKLEERQVIHALWGEFSDSEDYDLVSDYWKRRFSTFFVSWP